MRSPRPTAGGIDRSRITKNTASSRRRSSSRSRTSWRQPIRYRAGDGDGLQTAQILLSEQDLEDRTRYLNIRNTMQTLFDLGTVVPVVNDYVLRLCRESGGVRQQANFRLREDMVQDPVKERLAHDGSWLSSSSSMLAPDNGSGKRLWEHFSWRAVLELSRTESVVLLDPPPLP